ncbi:MAG: hypothetical protein ACK55I_30960, partial [bacterium]
GFASRIRDTLPCASDKVRIAAPLGFVAAKISLYADFGITIKPDRSNSAAGVVRPGPTARCAS